MTQFYGIKALSPCNAMHVYVTDGLFSDTFHMESER